MNGTGRRRAHGAGQDAALRVTLVRKRRAGVIAASVATHARESERSIAARRSIEHAHAVSELRDAVARAHASRSDAQCERSHHGACVVRWSSRRSRGKLGDGGAPASDRRWRRGGVTVASINARVEALIALTAR